MSIFKALPQESTAEVLADELRVAILNGHLAPGSRLIEQDLAEQFEISRGPIREAIRILAAEGLADLRKNRGAVVASPTMDDVLEVYAIRMAMGAIAINHLARRATQENIDFTEAQELIARMQDSETRRSNAQMIHADLVFQNQLVALSGLPRITDSFERSATDIRMFIRALNITYDTTDHDNLVARHNELIQAIRSGNHKQAVELWQDHIRKSVAEFTKDFTSVDLENLFDRPLMNQVFTDSARGLH